MKKTLACAALAASLLLPGPAPAEPRPAFVSGSGMILLDGEHRTFAFHALRNRDGSIRGGGVLVNRTSDIRLLLEIDCMRIDGNVVTLSGTHKDSTDPTYVGQPFWFRVVDNGEGENDPPDEITLVVTFPGGFGPDCTGEYPIDLQPILGGNVQVHP